MKKVYAKHEPYTNGHLKKIYDEMELSNPIIRVVEFDGDYMAIEGSHRLYCSYTMGVIPRLIVLESELEGIPDSHWKRIKDTLPVYEFDYVMVLTENEFNKISKLQEMIE